MSKRKFLTSDDDEFIDYVPPKKTRKFLSSDDDEFIDYVPPKKTNKKFLDDLSYVEDPTSQEYRDLSRELYTNIKKLNNEYTKALKTNDKAKIAQAKKKKDDYQKNTINVLRPEWAAKYERKQSYGQKKQQRKTSNKKRATKKRATKK